jgi:hypothetical protein
MLGKILQIFAISCRHKNTSQPFAAAASRPVTSSTSNWDPVPAGTQQHYVVCLDCARKFEYDWNQMRIVS